MGSTSTRDTRVVTGRVPLIALAWIVVCSAGASAQTSRVALDVVVAADGFAGSTQQREPGVWFDVFGAVRLYEGLDLVARPVVTRSTFDGEWQTHIYQLGVRYERPRDAARRGLGGLGLRIDAGQLPSPIGLGLLENRADANPVISEHSAYYMRLPRVDLDVPRPLFLIAGTYPLGVQVTLAGRSWDARGAFIDTSPVRGRSFFDADNPPRLGNWVAGFGVTPRVGLRIGAALAHGPYQSSTEIPNRSGGNRDATMVQLEGEWSFGYTRLAGELVRSSMETSRTAATTGGGWIEVTQTLTPRVFVAARGDTQRFEYPLATGHDSRTYQRYETVVGVRLTPELTLRAGYLVRKGYVVFHWDDILVASVVWQRKIW